MNLDIGFILSRESKLAMMNDMCRFFIIFSILMCGSVGSRAAETPFDVSAVDCNSTDGTGECALKNFLYYQQKVSNAPLARRWLEKAVLDDNASALIAYWDVTFLDKSARSDIDICRRMLSAANAGNIEVMSRLADDKIKDLESKGSICVLTAVDHEKYMISLLKAGKRKQVDRYITSVSGIENYIWHEIICQVADKNSVQSESCMSAYELWKKLKRRDQLLGRIKVEAMLKGK